MNSFISNVLSIGQLISENIPESEWEVLLMETKYEHVSYLCSSKAALRQKLMTVF